MNKLKLIIGSCFIVIITGIAIVSCDVLDQPAESFAELEQFFQDEGDAIAAVNAINQASNRHLWVIWINYEARPSDDMTNPAYFAIDRLRAVNEYTVDAQNREVNGLWNDFYRTIVRANLVINRVENMTPDQISQDVKNWVMGEAYFWRAFVYFDAVTMFGTIPLILTDNMGGLEINVPESSVEEIYAQVVADLKEAERLLPASFAGSNIGRPVETSATAMLSRVYIQQSNWEKTAEYAKKVIDSGRHWLFEDFQHAFSPFHNNGPEHIFSKQLARPSAGGPTGVWLNAVGVPRNSFHIVPTGGLAIMVPTIEAWELFEEGDYRRDVSFLTEFPASAAYASRNAGVEVGDIIPWQDFDEPIPHVYKFIDSRLTLEENQDINKVLIRYADVLLMYAEALNEMGQSGAALPYLNMIRERARNGDPSAPPQDAPAGISQSDLRDEIELERRRELVFEGHSRRDMVRTGKLVERISALRAPASGAPNKADNIQPHHVLWPKPAPQLELNPLLKQNPGYN